MATRLPIKEVAVGMPREQPMRACAIAKALEVAGDYDGAREALVDVWPQVGERPRLDGLDERAAAHVLLRVGALTGWIGDTRRIPSAQERARSLLDESCNLFTSQGDSERAAEARTEIAWCYWRDGAFDEARAMLRTALSALSDVDTHLRAHTLVRLAVVERMSGHLRDAHASILEAAPIALAMDDHALKGRFYFEKAAVLRNLWAAEHREDYLDEALIAYAASSFHLEQAGHLRFCASVENNLGFLFSTLGRFDEAHEHIDRARRVFRELKERGSVAQVDETRARALLAEGRNVEAEAAVRASISAHEETGERSFLAQALATHGIALARVGNHLQATQELARAAEVAETAGDLEGAGKATLTLIEELGEHVSVSELYARLKQAKRFLAGSQHPETLARLRACAEHIEKRPLPSPKVIRLLRKRVGALTGFKVRISDDSLLGAGIQRGDVVKFRRTEQFSDGDLVAVDTPDGPFVVFVSREPDGRLRLEGAHPHCPVRRFSVEEVSVLGVACYE